MKRKVVRKTVKRTVRRKTPMPKQVMVKGWSKSKDKMVVAKKCGRRVSKSGKVYYEYRVNRSDLNKKTRL